VKLRVVHSGTGPIGRAALDGILNHPQLELVGLYVHAPEKVGLDAASLIGRAPCGVLATDDWKALLDLAPDCLSYHSNSIGREREAADDVCWFLERGVNAVTSSVFAWGFPPDVPADFAQVHAACARGASSAYFSGSDPGWGTTDLALSALAMAHEVECVRVGRYGFWGGYTAEYVCRHYYGFPMLISGGFLQRNWGPALQHLARAMDVEIEGWNVVWETASLDHDIVCGFGPVRAGTSAALRTELQAMNGGRPVAVVEHVDRVGLDAAPDWGRPHGPGPIAFRVEVEGSHSFTIEFNNPPRAFSGARTANEVLTGKSTAMPVVNAIPAVCRAPPGLLGPHDVLYRSTHNVRRSER
jgi:4-hydroxy-tetrahydrodipicolinate reductase